MGFPTQYLFTNHQQAKIDSNISVTHGAKRKEIPKDTKKERKSLLGLSTGRYSFKCF